MFLTLLLLFGLIGTPVASPVTVETAPDWAVPLGTGASVEPLIANNLAIVAGDNRTIYAMDIETGENVWSAVIPETAADTIVVNGENLLVPLSGGSLLELSLETGVTQDTIVLGTDPLREPLVIGGEIVVADVRGTVWVLDGETLEVGTTEVISGGVRDLVAVESTVIIAGADSTLHTMDLDMPGFVWETVTSSPVGIMEVTDDGNILLGLESGDVTMLSSEDGSTLWQQIPGTNMLVDVAFANESIIGITRGGDVYAINPDDGSILWQNVVATQGWLAPDRCDTSCILVQADGTGSTLMAEDGSISPGDFVTQALNREPAADESSLVIVTSEGDVLHWSLSDE